MKNLNMIFDSLVENGANKFKMGYYLDDQNILRFRKCFDDNRRIFLGEDECNYDSLLITSQISKMKESIKFLSTHGIFSGRYEQSIYAYVYDKEIGENSSRHSRFFCLTDDVNDSTLNVSYLKKYAEKMGLLMLGSP